MRVASALVLSLLLCACGGEADSTPKDSTAIAARGRPARFQLGPAAVANLRLATVEAGPRVMTGTRVYPGVVRYRDTARAHLVAQVEGVVRELAAGVGQRVGASDVVCVIDSRELGAARSALLGSLSRARLAETMFRAEADLWEKKITSRDGLVLAEHAWTEARLAASAARQELLSLGLPPEELEELEGLAILAVETLAPAEAEAPSQAGAGLPSLSVLECRAPMGGEIVDVLVSRGEAVSAGDGILEVADLSRVWIDTRVPADDLAVLDVGNPVTVVWSAGGARAESELIYIAPEVEASNQTALARVELANPDGTWRPGLYVQVEAEVQRQQVALAVPTGALVTDPAASGAFVVFVERAPGDYEATPVDVQRTDGGFAAVSGRLAAGDRVVTGETLFLKAVWLGEGGLEE